MLKKSILKQKLKEIDRQCAVEVGQKAYELFYNMHLHAINKSLPFEDWNLLCDTYKLNDMLCIHATMMYTHFVDSTK